MEGKARMDWLKDYAPTATAILTLLVGFWQFSRKQSADSDTTYLEAVREDIDKLRARIDSLDEYIIQLEVYITVLQTQLSTAGIKYPDRPQRSRFIPKQ
jgi:predicted enzyme involved in methoxymalonyl-ACP biosynthesis